MREMLILLLALLAGASLGTIFFAGLWWTVLRGVASKQPAFWFLGSLLLRSTIAVAGFYYVMHGDWRRLVACLSGFVLARVCVLRFTNDWLQKNNRIMEGVA